jgi:hypothetical protein
MSCIGIVLGMQASRNIIHRSISHALNREHNYSILCAGTSALGLQDLRLGDHLSFEVMTGITFQRAKLSNIGMGTV